jgi:hypothetical protein
MAAFIVLLIIIGLVVYGLERNHRRGGLAGRLAGSSEVQDRDAERVLAELSRRPSDLSDLTVRGPRNIVVGSMETTPLRRLQPPSRPRTQNG